jgi:hypothetical protein
VALSAKGDTAVIGAPIADSNRGAAWAFARAGGTWAQQGAALTGRGEVKKGGLGAAVAVSADGGTAILGGPGDNHDLGTAWVFVNVPRVAVIGRYGFASGTGQAGIFLGCFGRGPCKGSVAITRAGSVIARLDGYALDADSGGLIRLPLSAAARRTLARGPVRVTVSVADADGTSTSADLTLIPLRPKPTPAHQPTTSASSQFAQFAGAGLATRSGSAAILLGCTGAKPCVGAMTVSHAGSVVGRRARFSVPGNDGAIIRVQLTRAARKLLGRNPAWTVLVSVTDGAGRRTSRLVTLQTLE